MEAAQHAPNGGERRSNGRELAPRVYSQLRRIAQNMLARERAGHLLSPTGLVHEAYLRVERGETDVQWSSPAHFRAVCTTVMRRILIEHARRRNDSLGAIDDAALVLCAWMPPNGDVPVEPFEVRQVLMRLRSLSERRYRIVEMRIYGGLTLKEVALRLGLSLRTIEREWAMAKTWIKCEMIRRGALDLEW